MSELEKIINDAFDNKDSISISTTGHIREAVNNTLDQLDAGTLRVCEKVNGKWSVNQWLKKAILLSFRLNENEISSGPYATWFDKVASKTVKWSKEDHLNRIVSNISKVPINTISTGRFSKSAIENVSSISRNRR